MSVLMVLMNLNVVKIYHLLFFYFVYFLAAQTAFLYAVTRFLLT